MWCASSPPFFSLAQLLYVDTTQSSLFKTLVHLVSLNYQTKLGCASSGNGTVVWRYERSGNNTGVCRGSSACRVMPAHDLATPCARLTLSVASCLLARSNICWWDLCHRPTSPHSPPMSHCMTYTRHSRLPTTRRSSNLEPAAALISC